MQRISWKDSCASSFRCFFKKSLGIKKKRKEKKNVVKHLDFNWEVHNTKWYIFFIKLLFSFYLNTLSPSEFTLSSSLIHLICLHLFVSPPVMMELEILLCRIDVYCVCAFSWCCITDNIYQKNIFNLYWNG